jgi:23S rRNA (cytosine1962-C5)-methyltransferase
MNLDLFEDVITGAAMEASTHLNNLRGGFRVLKILSSGLDHPKLASFPEGDYLKGLLLERF